MLQSHREQDKKKWAINYKVDIKKKKRKLGTKDYLSFRIDIWGAARI